jgi:dihydrolipoamide dehydrogenase
VVERKKCDIAIVGAGPGGYIAAIEAARHGKAIALIDKGFLGGTCLNIGCIPTKTLLAHAALLHQVKRAAEFGIQTGPISFSYAAMKMRKDRVVKKLRASLEGLLRTHGIEIFTGVASFEGPRELKVQGKDTLYITAPHIILATGSTPLDIPAFPCDHKQVLNSTSILEITQLPKSLAIIGGGYIGCEFASLFAELGVKVTILEALPSIVATQGTSVSSFLTKAFTQKGIEIMTNTQVLSIDRSPSGTQIHLASGKSLSTELTLVAAGRRVASDTLALAHAGLSWDERGCLPVNDKMETAVPGIFAIGDMTGKAMLAHVASHQGVVAAKNACGQSALMHYEAVPAVIFTLPEIARVGLSAEEAKAQGHAIVQGAFPFQALGKAEASLDTEGFTEIIADAKTGQILGALAIGHEASNLIAEMALAIQNELLLESVVETIHAHPTLAESWHEAATLALGMPIHLPPRKRRE